VRKLVGTYVVWGLLVIILALVGIFRIENDPSPGFLLTSFIFLPGIIFVIWYLSSTAFRQFVLALDARKVTLLQCIRLFGPVFYIGYLLKVYPAAFGIPATIMDTTWGITTPIIASLWSRVPFLKRTFVTWHILGIIELMGLATLRILTLPTSLGILLRPGGVTSDGLSVLPWSLLPTFVAANLIIWHLICAIHGLRVGGREADIGVKMR
jgi:hypothetical protein